MHACQRPVAGATLAFLLRKCKRHVWQRRSARRPTGRRRGGVQEQRPWRRWRRRRHPAAGSQQLTWAAAALLWPVFGAGWTAPAASYRCWWACAGLLLAHVAGHRLAESVRLPAPRACLQGRHSRAAAAVMERAAHRGLVRLFRSPNCVVVEGPGRQDRRRAACMGQNAAMRTKSSAGLAGRAHDTGAMPTMARARRAASWLPLLAALLAAAACGAAEDKPGLLELTAGMIIW